MDRGSTYYVIIISPEAAENIVASRLEDGALQLEFGDKRGLQAVAQETAGGLSEWPRSGGPR